MSILNRSTSGAGLLWKMNSLLEEMLHDYPEIYFSKFEISFDSSCAPDIFNKIITDFCLSLKGDLLPYNPAYLWVGSDRFASQPCFHWIFITRDCLSLEELRAKAETHMCWILKQKEMEPNFKIASTPGRWHQSVLPTHFSVSRSYDDYQIKLNLIEQWALYLATFTAAENRIRDAHSWGASRSRRR